MNYKPIDYYELQDDRFQMKGADKGNRFNLISFIVALVLLLLICFITAISLISFAYFGEGDNGTDYSLMERFNTSVTNLQGEALDGIFEMKKLYIIPENDVVAPTPNDFCYGTASTLEEMQKVYESAQAYGLVSVSDSLFLSDSDWNGKEVKYYLDETILAVMWKSKVDGQTYNFSEICVAHPSQFRRYLIGDTFGSLARDTTSSISAGLNAVVGMNGDFYGYRSAGIVVYRRKLYRFRPSSLDVCLVDSKGNLHLLTPDEIGTREEFEKYIENNDILFSLSFGPILIENGQVREKFGYYGVGEITRNFARAAFGQVAEKHYLLCTVDGSISWVDGTTPDRVAIKLGKMGCVNAYTLDGGQTATIYYNGKVFNRVGYGNERPISDVIYFATAIPN